MNYETKVLLKRSINEFLSSTSEEQDEMIYSIKEKLKQHENGLNSIGYGFAESYVKAAEVFLRLYDYKEVEVSETN